MRRHPEVAATTIPLRQSYDELPYPNRPKPFTHIARLAAIGRLSGLSIPELGQLLRERLKPDKPIDDAQWESLVRTHLVGLAKQGLLADTCQSTD